MSVELVNKIHSGQSTEFLNSDARCEWDKTKDTRNSKWPLHFVVRNAGQWLPAKSAEDLLYFIDET